jgi:hypothetical protein
VQGASNRPVIVISGLLTLLFLVGATLAIGLRNGWVQLASDAPAADAVITRVQPDAAEATLVAASAPGTQSPIAANTSEGEAVLYRQKLDEAYRALDEAYAQIRSLQTSQSQLASRGADADDDDDQRERRPRRRKSEHD